MHKNVTKCNKTLSKWCKNKHGASNIIDTFETYQGVAVGIIDSAQVLSAPYIFSPPLPTALFLPINTAPYHHR
jgi:hypothetical protein